MVKSARFLVDGQPHLMLQATAEVANEWRATENRFPDEACLRVRFRAGYPSLLLDLCPGERLHLYRGRTRLLCMVLDVQARRGRCADVRVKVLC
jgi:hypothetical protein